MAEEEKLTVDQAAALVNRKPRTIRRWIAQGLLPGYRPKVGRGTVVKRHELLAAVELVPIEPDEADDDDRDVVPDEIPQQGDAGGV